MGNFFSCNNGFDIIDNGSDIIDNTSLPANGPTNNKKHAQNIALTDAINRLCEILKPRDLKNLPVGDVNSVSSENRKSDEVPIRHEIVSNISNTQLDEEIDKLLDNPETNQEMIPDFIERRVYKASIKALLVTLIQISETSNINIFGHRIRIIVEPTELHSKVPKDSDEFIVHNN